MAASLPPTTASNSPSAGVKPDSSGASEATPASTERWLWGPVPDLLLGCGLLYMLILAVLIATGSSIREAQPGFVFPLLVLLISTPHYGATLVRVYEEAAERRRYMIFATWVSLLIWGVVVQGLFSITLASVLATVLFTWSPWHYTGQNYGIAMLFLRRRGVEVSAKAKRLLYGSFILSFVAIFLNLNAAGTAPSATPRGYTATNVHFISLNLRADIVDSLLAFVVVGFAATLIGAGLELSRKAKLRDLLPSALLCLVQILWFTLPLLVHRWQLAPGVESLNIQERTYYFLWTGLAHGIQYLWITSYYGKASSRWKGLAPYWGKTLLAGAAVWTLPVLFFGPLALGRLSTNDSDALSYDAGLALLVAAGVNLHHFMLDGVIWKLRNMRIASVLIRSAPAEESAGQASTRTPVLTRRAVWGLAGIALSVAVFVFVSKWILLPPAFARADYPTVTRTLDQLGWFGYDSHAVRAQLADTLRSEGDVSGSITQYQTALRLDSRVPDVHYRLANALRSVGETEQALGHYREALAIRPGYAEAHYNLGNSLAKLSRYNEAIEAYRDAIAAKPNFAQAHNNLGNALQTQGQLDDAIEQYRQALRIQPGYSNANDNLGRALRQKW